MVEEINKAIERVDADRVYNVTEMRRDNLFPWISESNHISYINAIFEDMGFENFLKAKVTGRGRGRDYRIRGKNIIKFLESQNEHQRNHKEG